MKGAPHVFPVRVYYEDTDAAGIVYHANYLKFAERARSEILRTAGFDHAAFAAQTGCAFVVTRVEADYRAPARLDDALTVETALKDRTAARLVLEQTVRRSDEPLVEMAVTLVCIDRQMKAAKLPSRIEAIFGSGDAVLGATGGLS